MGIYDRPYYRDDQPRGFSLGGQRSMVANLIIINVAIAFIDFLTDHAQGISIASHKLSYWLSVNPEVLTHPWNLWKLVTYGFAHAALDTNPLHIVFNMYMLWLFGRDIEGVYGRREFLLVYLALVVLSGLAWTLIELMAGGSSVMVGASGAVMGVMILFVLHFPHRRFLLIFPPMPVPAWVLAVVYVGLDLFGALGARGGNVAFTCHLAGAGAAFLYFRLGVRLERWLPFRFSIKSLKPKPKLRVHDPEDRYRQLDTRADRILDKLHRKGAGSLSAEERRILEDYSRRMRQKHS